MSSSAARRITENEPSPPWTEEELAKLRRQKERIARESATAEGIAFEMAMAQLNKELLSYSDDSLRMIAAQDDIDPNEPLDPELEKALNEAEEEYKRGDFVDAEGFLAELRQNAYG